MQFPPQTPRQRAQRLKNNRRKSTEWAFTMTLQDIQKSMSALKVAIRQEANKEKVQELRQILAELQKRNEKMERAISQSRDLKEAREKNEQLEKITKLIKAPGIVEIVLRLLTVLGFVFEGVFLILEFIKSKQNLTPLEQFEYWGPWVLTKIIQLVAIIVDIQNLWVRRYYRRKFGQQLENKQPEPDTKPVETAQRKSNGGNLEEGNVIQNQELEMKRQMPEQPQRRFDL